MALTKEYIKKRYDVDVSQENESAPDIKGSRNETDEMVTLNIAYYKNEYAGIGRFSFVNDICSGYWSLMTEWDFTSK